ncbi:unnamed protein product, partial [Ceratitis capitata]
PSETFDGDGSGSGSDASRQINRQANMEMAHIGRIRRSGAGVRASMILATAASWLPKATTVRKT